MEGIKKNRRIKMEKRNRNEQMESQMRKIEKKYVIFK